MIPGARTADGSLRIKTTTPGGTEKFLGGYALDPAAAYSIQASCEVNGTVVTLSNAALVVQVEPVKSFT